MAKLALHTHTRRRPKSINDIDKLVAIADLLAKNPAMKRTTAIKALGIQDPTTIRRLRKKLGSPKTQKIVPCSDANSLDAQIVALKNLSQKHKATSERRPSPANTQHGKRTPSKSHSAINVSPKEPQDNTQDQPHKPDLVSCLFSANLAAGQAVIQFQFKMWSYAFQVSPLACYLRNQELLRLTVQNLNKVST